MDFKDMPNSVDLIPRNGQWFVVVTSRGDRKELGPFDMPTARRIASEQMQRFGNPAGPAKPATPTS